MIFHNIFIYSLPKLLLYEITIKTRVNTTMLCWCKEIAIQIRTVANCMPHSTCVVTGVHRQNPSHDLENRRYANIIRRDKKTVLATPLTSFYYKPMGFLCLKPQPQIPRMGMKHGFIKTHENCLFFLILFSKRYSILGIGSSSLCLYITSSRIWRRK